MGTWCWWGDLRERGHLEDADVDGKIILRWIFRKFKGALHWIDQVRDRDRWRTRVNAVMNFRIPLNTENFLTSSEQVSFLRKTLFHGVSK